MNNYPNTKERAFKFQFDLEIQRIKLYKNIEVPKNTYLEVIWKRGQNNIATKVKPEFKGNEEEIKFDETVSMISTCVLNCETGEFNVKQSVVSVVIYIEGSQKLFGSITLNLCSVLSGKNYHERSTRQFEEELNSRTKSKIVFRLNSSFISEMYKGDDQQSVGSGVNSTSYNASSFNRVQRRLIDIPSKDTYSVMSYGASMRYSNKKQDALSIKRQDSSKKPQQQASRDYSKYSNFGNSQPNFYAKSSDQYNLSKGTSNIQYIPSVPTMPTMPSIPSSTSRIPKSNESEHNRSSVGEQNSRLLIEEQNKRSKIQAQMTKNKVENEELKAKLSEYVRQNMKLKQQLKKFNDNNDVRQAETKKEAEELRERNYVLGNQVKQLRSRFDRYANIERELGSLKNERQNLLRVSKQNEDERNIMRVDLDQTKRQLLASRENENRLYNELKQIKINRLQGEQNKRRQLQTRIKQMGSQLQYYQNNQRTLNNVIKEKEDLSRNLQVKLGQLQSSLDSIRLQNQTRIDQIYRTKQKQIGELRNQLQQKTQQSNRNLLEIQRVRADSNKVKDEKIAQLEVSKGILSSEVQRLNQAIKQKNNKVEQFQQENISLNNQIRNQVLMRSKQTQKTKQVEEMLNQSERRYQRDTGEMRKTLQQLEMENIELNKILSEKNKNLEESKNSRQQVQVLMKQNLQLQLQIKYKNEGIVRLNQLEQQYQNLKCRCHILQQNIKQLNQNQQKLQREVREKNRAYVLQCQKTKIISEQRLNAIKSANQLKDENNNLKQQLVEKQTIIGNGERQFAEMTQYIGSLENQRQQLINDMRNLEQKYGKSSSLEQRIKDLQLRDAEKIKSIELLSSRLNESNNRVKQLQLLSEDRYKQLVNKDQIIAELDGRAKQLEQVRSLMDQDLVVLSQEKNNLARKNDMIMQELYGYKKKFQEQKGRSYSSIQVKSSQEYLKVKNLENELQKKDSQIRKLQKEMMELENENINLNIQVMRGIGEMTTPQPQ